MSTHTSVSSTLPSDRLANRTFIGLLIAQFLAAFNDQAMQVSAMFFAIRQGFPEPVAISLLPILFYSPWAIFCTLAGWLADRYSKRSAMVIWKFAEIPICGLALLGFWLGSPGNAASSWHQFGPWFAFAAVFMMGAQSTFFVPAKYGSMPQIFQPHLLSRGNGWLESLSFLAIISGTVCGGVMSYVWARNEVNIGWTLVILAVIGAVATLFVRWLPPADPRAPFPRYVYGPLWENVKTLVRIRPLRIALVGLAFFTFVVAYMRSVIYMTGESANPRWGELRTSFVVGTVALGIGLGSPLAGYLSGKKIELGLIPLGIAGMCLCCIGAAASLGELSWLVACIVGIGICTGFYLVPLYTILQYRSPQDSKGKMIATNNLISVIGATSATLLFFALTWTVQQTGVVPRVNTEDIHVGVLEKISYDEGGKATGFRIDLGDGETFTVGTPRRAKKPPSVSEVFDQMINPPHQDVVIEPAMDIQIGSEVTVSTWRLHDITHYSLRTVGTPSRTYYDYQHLPKFLFFGAAFMTLLTLVMLWIQLPDLIRRAGWFLHALVRRVRTDGVGNVSGTAPVLLVTDASNAAGQHFITSAVDRVVLFIDPKTTGSKLGDEAVARLEANGVVGLVMQSGEETENLRRRLTAVENVQVVPVHFEEHLVRFSPPVGPETTPDLLREMLKPSESKKSPHGDV